MLYIQDSKIFMKNVLSGITCECFMKGHEVSEKAAHLVVLNTLINRKSDFSYDRKLRKDEFTKLLDICVAELCTEDKMKAKLIKLQTCFHAEYGSDSNVLQEYEDLVQMYLEPLSKSIIGITPDNYDGFDKLFRLIIVYCILHSGLGNPSDPKVFEETKLALCSVFPETDLADFVGRGQDERRVIISEVSHVVAGVRLFNKSRGKGGETLEDYADILHDSLHSTMCLILLHIEHSRQIVKPLQRFIEHCLYWGRKGTTKVLLFTKPSSLTEEEFKYAYSMLLIQQQVISFLRKLYFHVRDSIDQFPDLVTSYSETLQRLSDVIASRTAIPTNIVYPDFYELSFKWKKFYRGVVILAVYEKVLYNLVQFLQFEDMPEALKDLITEEEKNSGLSHDIFGMQKELKLTTEEFHRLLNSVENGDLEFYTNFDDVDKKDEGDEDGEEEEGFDEDIEYGNKSFTRIDSSKMDSDLCKVVYPSREEMNDYEIMFGGFDPVYFLKTGGLVLEAEPDLGLIVYRGYNIGFRSVTTAHFFGKEPHIYFAKILDFVKKNTNYIEVLQVRDVMGDLDSYGSSIEADRSVIAISDKSMQTELHPIESHIDPYYCHSIWTMNAAACKMADLMEKRTKGCQTTKSYFRECVRTMTYPLKTTGAQTMKDNWTNTATPKVFRWGLRGRPHAEPSTVSLTMPLEDPSVALIQPRRTAKRDSSTSEVSLLSISPAEVLKNMTKEFLIQKVEAKYDHAYYRPCCILKVHPHPPMFYLW